VITLLLTIPSGSPAGICAVDLALACESNAVAIRPVTVNEAFPVVLVEEPVELPASSYRSRRLADELARPVK
jgi:hypothetical protein